MFAFQHNLRNKRRNDCIIDARFFKLSEFWMNIVKFFDDIENLIKFDKYNEYKIWDLESKFIVIFI